MILPLKFAEVDDLGPELNNLALLADVGLQPQSKSNDSASFVLLYNQ